MDIKNIKSLRSIDLLKLLLYSFAGLSIPLLGLMLILQLLGVPMTINEIDYYGSEGLIYSLLFIPTFLLVSAFVFWLYLGLGWKIARWGLKALGKS
ncbi:hypothetical protein [Roseivirga sp. E12]|uniref:hypothetical protein n=1 Tax=Roseivirga sp. E12 TaxID=2819237 RepID=UPI001ABC30DD|nr:hypothetical protein [Roseivirga sp. E12]MBO3699308.1 hypothetical protein [Roseivirga sp. E12]